MLITFSHHYGVKEEWPRPSVFLPLTRYMDAPTVAKRIGPQQSDIARDPPPEILAGQATSLRRMLAALPFRRRYTSFVLSFAQGDIDCAAFNAGDPLLRGQVDLALQLVLEAAWAGIPDEARPPFYITTHSHTGRLEVNLALPRVVFRPDGRLMSHNPHPPTDRPPARTVWGALQDLVNHRFGWADPGDPMRQRLLMLPDLVEKQAAERRRAGHGPGDDPGLAVAHALQAAIAHGAIRCHEDALNCLEVQLEEHNLARLAQGHNSVVIGARDASPSHHLRLRGPIFRPGFVVSESGKAERAARDAELATAPERFSDAWKARAHYNHARYGQGRWSQTSLDFDLSMSIQN